MRLDFAAPQMRVAFRRFFGAYWEMGLPSEPVTLSVEELGQLNHDLANLRHDVNNQLSLIMAAVELARHKPPMVEWMLATIGEQPPKVSEAMRKFTVEFEKALGITRA